MLGAAQSIAATTFVISKSILLSDHQYPSTSNEDSKSNAIWITMDWTKNDHPCPTIRNSKQRNSWYYGWAPWHHHLRDFHLSTPGEVSMIQMLVNLWLVVEPTHLKNILVKLGIFPQIGMNIINVWNHHLDLLFVREFCYFLNAWQLYLTHGINLFNGFLQHIAPTFFTLPCHTWLITELRMDSSAKGGCPYRPVSPCGPAMRWEAGWSNHRASGPRSHVVTRPYAKRASGVFKNFWAASPAGRCFDVFFVQFVWIVDVLIVFLNPCDFFLFGFSEICPPSFRFFF